MFVLVVDVVFLIDDIDVWFWEWFWNCLFKLMEVMDVFEMECGKFVDVVLIFCDWFWRGVEWLWIIFVWCVVFFKIDWLVFVIVWYVFCIVVVVVVVDLFW